MTKNKIICLFSMVFVFLFLGNINKTEAQTIGFTQPCYHLAAATEPVSIDFSGVDVSGLGAKVTLFDTTGVGTLKCIVLPGVAGTVFSTVDNAATWKVDLYENSDCGTSNLPVKASGNTIVKSTPCASSLSCDSSSYFFCNTLLGTVDNIFQGGEKMIGYILGLIGSVALLLLIIAGIMYLTSAGNEEKIALSKKIITGTVIGLGIALLAFSLLDVVLTILNS